MRIYTARKELGDDVGAVAGDDDLDDDLDVGGEHLDGLRSLGLPVIDRRPIVPLAMSAPTAALVAESWAPATRHCLGPVLPNVPQTDK